MSLSVKHLNADSTFHLTFSPNTEPDSARDRLPGSFNVLVDPWLAGDSSLWSPRFQLSRHTIPSCVQSLSDIPLPDVILISQVKPDHCHRETLCTLPRNTPVTIYAVPEAAKLIKSWGYFQEARIVALDPYNKRKAHSVKRVPIKPYSSGSAPGEITISHVPEKADMTGLHNALGITYRPPGTTRTTQANLPITPLHTADLFRSDSADSYLVTPVDSAYASPEATDGSQSPLFFTAPKPPPEQTISVLYTPHGVNRSTIAPYINNHLRPINALPLTALFHGLNIEQNPWLMGGQVARGLPSGIALAKDIGTRYWISAHDEMKINLGWSTLWLKSKQFSIADAQAALDAELEKCTGSAEDHGTLKTKAKTAIIELGVGHEFKT